MLRNHHICLISPVVVDTVQQEADGQGWLVARQVIPECGTTVMVVTAEGDLRRFPWGLYCTQSRHRGERSFGSVSSLGSLSGAGLPRKVSHRTKSQQHQHHQQRQQYQQRRQQEIISIRGVGLVDAASVFIILYNAFVLCCMSTDHQRHLVF